MRADCVDSAQLKAKMDLFLNVIRFRACARRKGGRHGGRGEPPSGVRRQDCCVVGRTGLCWVFLKLLPGFKSRLRFSVSQELRF